jgi:hypothetical protein
MKAISDVFRSRRQQELSGFVVYILEDGPADGESTVRCIAFDLEADVLRCCFLKINGVTAEYELTVLRDVYGPLHATEFDQSGTIGGLRCVIGIFDHEFFKVTGTPNPLVFRNDRERAIHYGRIA